MIGIDIISTARFADISKSDYDHWSKFFTEGEWRYCFSKASPSQSLSGIYAAKEAVMKAVGKDLMARVDRIEVNHLKDGKPIIKIDKKSQPNIHISISHTTDTAAAVAIKYETKDI
jgi:phosphopantetheine--protein transferase-like protein